MVIFGASGDLTKRKLLPALYNLAHDGLLSKHFAVIGVSRSEMTHEQFREKMGAELREFATAAFDEQLWNWFAERLYYLPGDMDKARDLPAPRKTAARGGRNRMAPSGTISTTWPPRHSSFRRSSSSSARPDWPSRKAATGGG